VTRAEARRRFGASSVARLATADAAGQPHLVPIVFALAGDHIYSVVDAKPKRSLELRRLANLRENPAVALAAVHPIDTLHRAARLDSEFIAQQHAQTLGFPPETLVPPAPPASAVWLALPLTLLAGAIGGALGSGLGAVLHLNER